jgi:hypothetical protein
MRILAGRAGVVAGPAVFPPRLQVVLGFCIIPVFEVRHVDVRDAVHPVEALERIVGRGVVDDRKAEPAACRNPDSLQAIRALLSGATPDTKV